MSTDPGDAIRRRDEILQVMVWMRGEGLGDAQGVDDLRRFLTDVSEATLAEDLSNLALSGLVEETEGERYRLTVAGRAEGGRRFQEEFEELMRQGHGACSDPNCDCHQLGPEACVHAHPS